MLLEFLFMKCSASLSLRHSYYPSFESIYVSEQVNLQFRAYFALVIALVAFKNAWFILLYIFH